MIGENRLISEKKIDEFRYKARQKHYTPITKLYSMAKKDLIYITLLACNTRF